MLPPNPDTLQSNDIDPAWVALSLLKHVGSKTLRAMLAHFDNDLHAILHADAAALRQVRGVGSKIASAVQQIDVPATARAMQRWQSAGVQIVTLFDPTYPARLRDLDDAPPTLFVRGSLQQAHRLRGIAMIGTRTPTREAAIAAHRVAAQFADAGYTLVSGLALGIDSLAHRAALDRSAGSTIRTLAVLGSGVLDLYPPENIPLAKEVMSNGALLCEVAPDAPVSPAGLVARNRIITGLCERIIVIESEVGGGAMHAARFAFAQGRKVYTLDLPASGNQWLLANGAELLRVDDDE
jgi:DNA processing protein